MKSFKEYLTENQKTYSFKVKVAGSVPEKFVETVKSRLEKYGCSKFSQVGTTPIQATAMDFPELCNVEVTMFEAECAYPVTPPEILMAIRNSVSISETHIRVRNTREAEELDALALDNEQSTKKSKALLDDPSYKEAEKIKSKNYFGDDFNKALLKDLQKTAKQRKKDLGQKDAKTEITSEGPDYGSPASSVLGSSKGK
jgi:hypothetical protein